MLSTEIREWIVKQLLLKHNPWVIYLFGSYAKQSIHPKSDIDLALASDDPQDPYTLFMTAQELASYLHREVDLVDLTSASTVFQTQIISTGHPLYCADETRRLSQEALIYKMYARLNEERQVVIDRILANASGDKPIDEYESGVEDDS